MIARFVSHLKAVMGNSRGVAVLMSVIMTMVVTQAVVVDFMAETNQKQSGGAMTYTSTYSFFLAESGLRYAEKCMRSPDAGCPCHTSQGGPGCSATSAIDLFSFTKDFGREGGQFQVLFDYDELHPPDVRIISKGKFGGAVREISRLLCSGDGMSCKLSANAVTTCMPINLNNSAYTDGNTEGNYCDIEPAPQVVLNPPEDGDCDVNPDPNYPVFNESLHLDSDGFLKINSLTGKYTYCNMVLSRSSGKLTQPFRLPANANLIVAKNFTITNKARLEINGVSKILVKGNMLLDLYSQTYLNAGAVLTMITNGNFHMRNSAWVNNGGDPANVMTFIGGDGLMENSIIYYGALYGQNLDLQLENTALIQGSVVANSVTLSNNSTLIFDEDAGSNSGDYSLCGSSVSSSACMGATDPSHSWGGA